jgi:hypothetical protein
MVNIGLRRLDGSMLHWQLAKTTSLLALQASLLL